MFKLNPEEARAALTKALRSGEYTQTTGTLRDDKGFCCLGVACNVFLKIEEEGEWVEAHDPFGVVRQGFLGKINVLPPHVALWLGFACNNPAVRGVTQGDSSLAGRNDAGAAFEEIAAMIEGGKVDLE